jgi:hypothetical protein
MPMGFTGTMLAVAAIATSTQAQAETLARAEGVALLRERVVPAGTVPAQSTRIVIQDEGTAMERTVACLLVGTTATAGTVAYAGQGLLNAFTAGVGNTTVFGVLLGGALFMTYCSIGMVLTPLYVRVTRGNEIELPAPPPLRAPPRAAVQPISATR